MTPVTPRAHLALHNNVVSISIICDDREEALRVHHQLRVDAKNYGPLSVDFFDPVFEWDQIVGEHG